MKHNHCQNRRVCVCDAKMPYYPLYSMTTTDYGLRALVVTVAPPTYYERIVLINT